MARTTKKPLTGKQKEVADLMKAQPDITPTEIADMLGTSPGTIYQTISRIRAGGRRLPKGSNGRRRPAAEPDAPEDPAAVINGATLEEHLAVELQETIARIEEIEGERQTLEAEQQGLTHRRERLTAAQEALTTS